MPWPPATPLASSGNWTRTSAVQRAEVGALLRQAASELPEEIVKGRLGARVSGEFSRHPLKIFHHRFRIHITMLGIFGQRSADELSYWKLAPRNKVQHFLIRSEPLFSGRHLPSARSHVPDCQAKSVEVIPGAHCAGVWVISSIPGYSWLAEKTNEARVGQDPATVHAEDIERRGVAVKQAGVMKSGQGPGNTNPNPDRLLVRQVASGLELVGQRQRPIRLRGVATAQRVGQRRNQPKAQRV